MKKRSSKYKFHALGKSAATPYPQVYTPALLEVFENRFPEMDSVVELEAFEFTSLCPVTGQPDQGTIHIRYIPKQFLVESKSLKLYLFSFRNEGVFHEEVINRIACDLDVVMRGCKYLEVFGRFHSRGGIAIYPKAIIAHDIGYQNLVHERKLCVPFEKNYR